MKPGRLSALFLSFLFPILLFAQVADLNVKLRPGQQDLQQRLHTVAENPALLSDPAFRQSIPFLQNLKSVSALSSATHPSFAGSFNLVFEKENENSLKNLLYLSGQFEYVESNQKRKTDVYKPLQVQPPSDSGVSLQWYHSRIGTFSAWEITKGDATVVIGVLDTGLDYEHPEFDGKVALNPQEDINGNGRFEPWNLLESRGGVTGDFDGLDNDGNGFHDDVIGFDFTDQPRSPFGGDFLGQDGDPMDDNNHGTLVSGIIAAKENNQSGGCGIAPGCRLKVLRAFSASGTGEDDDIARAIVYAADNGVQILNFSFGDIYESRTLHDAVKYAASKGLVMVASAGNATGDSPHYPSSFPEVISVSATMTDASGQTETLWPLSSFGFSVDIAAPGSDIYCPVLHNEASGLYYDYFSGTSTSAPMVSAAAALLFSQRGRLSPAQTRGILCSTADDLLDSGWDHYTGAGRLNLARLLAEPSASRVELEMPEGSAENFIRISGSILHPRLQTWNLEFCPGTSDPAFWMPIDSGTTQMTEDSLALWNVQGLSEGEFTVRLRANLSDGKTAEDRFVFLRDTAAETPIILYAGEAWDNELKKVFLHYRSEDRGNASLLIRDLSGTDSLEIPYDRITRTGYFLLGSEILEPGNYEIRVKIQTLAGWISYSAPDTISFAPAGISKTGYSLLPYSIPMGAYLPGSFDFDSDGLKEVVMSQYDSTLNFGPLAIYEQNASQFVPISPLPNATVLIPKDIRDIDGNGTLEVLASLNDSFYVFSQSSANSFALNLSASSLGQSWYPARWADTDGDGQYEVLAKDPYDYFILEPSGTSFNLAETLEDISSGYEGSVAPKALFGDFDSDGKTEIVYGDFDGDLLIYEQLAGNQYQPVFLDSTELVRSGSFLCQGDFDGDGKEEIFVAAHSSRLRNADFEYDPPFWLLRIFKSSGNDQFHEVWSTRLFDLDTDNYNAATAMNADGDPQPEILFSTFPRTYLLDFRNGSYGFSWFHYGALCTHHVSGDFNGNSIPEFALGRGDSAFFFEWDQAASGPAPPVFLDGRVSGATSVLLDWLPSPDATEYLIFRGEYDSSGTFISLLDSTSSLLFADSGLISERTYLYVILSKNPSFNPAYSVQYSNAILLRPHAPFRADSAFAVNENSVRVSFSRPVADDFGMLSRILLDSAHPPISAVSPGDSSLELLLSFRDSLAPGTHILEFDTLFEDRFRGRIDTAYRRLSFSVPTNSISRFILSSWARLDGKSAVLRFSEIPDASALDPANYSVHPAGSVERVEEIPGDSYSRKLFFQEVVLGSLGYPVTVICTGIRSTNGNLIPEKEGNAATFLSSEESLSSVYVYPNPYAGNELFGGIRFANLSSDAVVEIISASGRKVQTLIETDADGGIEWNLQDAGGNRIKPGTYLYRVSSEKTGEEMLGTFSVVE